MNASDIQNFDISAKNPTKQNQVALKSTLELKDLIKTKTERINDLVNEVLRYCKDKYDSYLKEMPLISVAFFVG